MFINNYYNITYMVEKETRSVRLSDEAWEALRIHCIKKKLKVSEYMENLIRKDLKL